MPLECEHEIWCQKTIVGEEGEEIMIVGQTMWTQSRRMYGQTDGQIYDD